MKIFVTRQIPGNIKEALSSLQAEVVVGEFDRPLTAEELLERGKGVDALLTVLTDKINGDVIDAIGPQLKIVSNYAVGFDNINILEASDRGVVVTNTPCEEVNEAVAEEAVTLLLSLSRRIVEADESTKRGSYKGWEPQIFLGTALKGKTLGIVGMGRIGTLTALKAKGLGLNLFYYNRKPDPEAEKATGANYCSLDELYAKADFISLHVPLTDETRHMLDSTAFAKMKNGVKIINTARGQIILESDLVAALREGKVGGAALDVFDNEPNINPELIAMENVILTPHIASATVEARQKMSQLATSALVDTLTGKMPLNLINKEVWEKRRK
jgi:glyoxylate reductase